MSAQDWLATAPEGLVALMRRLTAHRGVKWTAEDYDEGDDGRQVAPSLEDAEAVSSRLGPTVDPWSDLAVDSKRHALLIDLDVPAWQIPSSTPGHSHLYVDLQVPEDDLWAFLEAAANIGLVEPGYVSACKSRGMTSLRAPWVHKGEEHLTSEEPPL